MTWLRVLLIALLMPSFALAEDQNTYSPEFCDFSIDFPDQPYKVRRCDEDNPNRCYDLVSFTQVFDMTTTVNFRVICNPISASVRKQYSGEVMQATLRAMTKSSVVQEFDTSYTEENGYKLAGLVGEGQVGRTPTLYIAQLWIGDNSAFSVEGELIGEINDGADELFSSTLRSIHFVHGQKEEPAEDETTETEPDS